MRPTNSPAHGTRRALQRPSERCQLALSLRHEECGGWSAKENSLRHSRQPWPSHSVTEAAAAGLQKRIVCATQDSLRLLDRIDLAVPGFLAHVVILHQEITFGVGCRDDIDSGHVLLGRLCVVLRVALEGGLSIGLGGTLVAERLHVLGPFVGGIGKHLFIIGLCILFLLGGHRHLLVHVSNQKIHHGNNTVAFRTLRATLACGRWRRWGRDGLDKRRDASACDAAWRWCGRGGATHVYGDPVLLRELAFGWGLVHFWVVK